MHVAHYFVCRAQNDPLTLVVNLAVPDSIILSRIEDRWVHVPSGRVYNVSYNPPKVPGRDDVTGEVLAKRPDDNPEIFARRLETYYKNTAPLIEYFNEQSAQMAGQLEGRMRTVTLAGETSDEIWPNLERAICTLFPSVRLREREEDNATAPRRRSSLTDPFTTHHRRPRLGDAVSGRKVMQDMSAGLAAK